MNRINAIQANNFYRVNSVNLFENSSNKLNSQRAANSGLFSSQTNSNYNLNHPKVAGSETQAKHLDLLA